MFTAQVRSWSRVKAERSSLFKTNKQKKSQTLDRNTQNLWVNCFNFFLLMFVLTVEDKRFGFRKQEVFNCLLLLVSCYWTVQILFVSAAEKKPLQWPETFLFLLLPTSIFFSSYTLCSSHHFTTSSFITAFSCLFSKQSIWRNCVLSEKYLNENWELKDWSWNLLKNQMLTK